MKDAESGYYLVKWTIDSYTLHYSNNMGNDVITDGELVCDAVYLNTISNFNQCYNYYENKNQGKFVSV